MSGGREAAMWELIVDDCNESVRRLAVPSGWIYQTQDGRSYSTVAGTIGRENDQGKPGVR